MKSSKCASVCSFLGGRANEGADRARFNLSR
jgi:hypothetical protein